MRNRDYADLVGLALAFATKKPCPICDSRAWKTCPERFIYALSGSDVGADAVPIVCGECGYVLTFLCSYLDRKATQLDAEGNGH
jgi:hypothetical protein